MDLTGAESKGSLRVSSLLRISIKRMLREDKIREIEPGVFKLTEWYKTDLQMKRLIPGYMTKDEVIAMLEDTDDRFKKEG